MRNPRSLALWLLAGVAGLVLLAWAYPRAFPFLPKHWSVSRSEAVAIAAERVRDLGEPVKDPYVVARLNQDYFLERQLQLALDRRGARSLWSSGLPGHILSWAVYFYPRGAQRYEWTYFAAISPTGEILELQLRLDPEAKGAAISPQEARARADAFLVREGIDL